MQKKQTPWREDPEILARLDVVERRHLHGESNRAIATSIGVDESTIRLDLKRLNELWRERIGAGQEQLRSEAVAKLEQIRVQALEAFAHDLQMELAVLFNEPVEIGGAEKRVYRDDKGSASFRGNKAAALQAARQAVMDMAKIMGIVVDKAALTDAEGQALTRFTIAIDRIASDSDHGA